MAATQPDVPPAAGDAGNAQGYAARFYPFSERPLSDSCWSLHTGPDGRIYAAACIEHTGGEAVSVVRYNEAADRLDYLFEMDEATGDLRDSGRATQCKIHYSFAPSPRDGLLYAATHLSGPPKGERHYNPWSSWHDKHRAFRGAYLVAFDTATDTVASADLMIPKEGCRCLCLDDERRRLYAITYPRDHLVYFDLASRRLTDVGRIGSVNTQCLYLDRRRRVHFTDDRGRFLRFDPDAERIEVLPHRYPHPPYQTGWHGVLYDAVADPAGEWVYMVPWRVHPHLARFRPDEGDVGVLEDLGPVTQERRTDHPLSMGLDHAGGLVFGLDGWLYYVKSVWPADMEKKGGWRTLLAQGVVERLHPETLAREEVCVLKREGESTNYVSRGGRDRHGNLYFGHVGNKPVGLFRVTVPGAGGRDDAHLPLRMWG